jgi:hypothetical protein
MMLITMPTTTNAKPAKKAVIPRGQQHVTRDIALAITKTAISCRAVYVKDVDH